MKVKEKVTTSGPKVITASEYLPVPPATTALSDQKEPLRIETQPLLELAGSSRLQLCELWGLIDGEVEEVEGRGGEEAPLRP